MPRTPDLAAHVLGRLDGPRATAVERRLAASPCLRVEAQELQEVARMLEGTVPSALPADLEARVLAAVAATPQAGAPSPTADPVTPVDELAARRAATTAPAPAARRRRRAGLAAAAACAAVALAAVLLGRGGDDATPPLPVELRAQLRPAAGGPLSADLVVRRGETGRVVTLRSSTLPALPKGVYYELWFVGPDDRPGAPQRISAGTFHPDAAGASDVTFHAAVDPAVYPGVAITREPGDGNPSPSGPDLVRTN
ncbi:hypothetical protein GKE82_15615 [Conexibacter sp. W3-3-2]|uniref:anti-sigma factor domain-containing protein n=1 Tax=Conexibacter sp. W3-3-2 TaxID=2675227 RepID=UPI0012B78CAA|nr:anti-sigma factor [Conexibacter sp. W3-3-2]MTD45675.1 hypothetical protein [Conexibacter sp. W3-3-2]